MPEQEQQQRNPYMPPGPDPLVMEHFEGMNTVALRPGVPDKQCAWIDGFIPLAPRNLRTLYGIGDALYDAPAGTTVVFFASYNIAVTAYHAVFLSDGSVQQVDTTTGVVTEVLAPGSIQLVTVLRCGLSQYGSTYLIIVSDQTNGYWLWDGVTTYTAGTLGPIVTMTDVGSGYATVPAVVAAGGSGSGATFTANIANGQVTDIAVTNPGSGYQAGETVTLTLTGGTQVGSGAALTAVMALGTAGSGATFVCAMGFNGSWWYLSGVTVTNGGSGYSQYTSIALSIAGTNFIGQPAAVASITAGVITKVTVTNIGVATSSIPPTAAAIDSGFWHVVSVTIGNGGSSYSGSAVATGSGGSSPSAQATYRLVLTSGVITSVVVTSGGIYGGATPPTISVTDSVTVATATVELMPFAIQGSTVETYSGHVWVASGEILYYSAPGSAVDFGSSNGGGNNTSSDSALRVRYTHLINANGFLWLLGDSSLSYISGVQTGGSPITTTYTLQDADPENGTPWPATVNTFGRDLVFANTWGAQTGSGGAVSKTSDMLDGIYNSVIPATQTDVPFAFQPSSAKTVVFNRKVWMLLIPIVNPVTGITENKLMMWDGKRWWASSQDVVLTFIATQEINSLLTAWGTDSLSIYPLFNQPSTAFTKTVQSRLWDVGGYWLANATSRFWAMFKYYSQAFAAVSLTIDNEDYPSNVETLDISIASVVTWTNNAGAEVTWANDAADAVIWYMMPLGIAVVQPTATAQQGVLTGFTLSTNDADMAIISAAVKPEIVQYRG